MQFTDAKKYKKQVKKLYKTAFPFDERWPMPLLYHKARKKEYNFHAVLDEGEFVGLTYAMESENFLYIFYLAVREDLRGKGYGSRILNSIKENNPGRTITLAIEDTDVHDAPNYEQRLRRLKFYRSNGFERLFIKIKEADVDFELLGTNNTVSKDEFFGLMRRFLGRILYRICYKSMIKKGEL